MLFTSQKNSLQNGLVLDPIQKNLKSISTRRFPLIRCPPYAHFKTFRGRVHPGKNPLPHPKARHAPGTPREASELRWFVCNVVWCEGHILQR